jgi:hypothetical protein
MRRQDKVVEVTIPAEKPRDYRENGRSCFPRPKKTRNLACCARGNKSEIRENPEEMSEIRAPNENGGTRKSAINQPKISACATQTHTTRQSGHPVSYFDVQP